MGKYNNKKNVGVLLLYFQMKYVFHLETNMLPFILLQLKLSDVKLVKTQRWPVLDLW